MNTPPRISLVTPSFNQSSFLARTLRSVLTQHYPKLQYIVVDGGSTDGSIDILEQHRAAIEAIGGTVIIEPDRGQAEAINKGLRRADGDIVGWLCSDDLLEPGSLRTVGEHFAAHPDDVWLGGPCRMIDAEDRVQSLNQPVGEFTLAGVLLRGPDRPFNLPQPGVFWRRSLHGQLGFLDESLHYCMDFEWWLRLLRAGHAPTLIDKPLAAYRLHESSKTCAQAEGFLREHLVIERHYARALPWRQRLAMWRRLGYQRRALAVRTAGDRLWPQVLCRPWWLLSQQIRAALRGRASRVTEPAV